MTAKAGMSVIAAALFGVAVYLWASSFFAAWDGRAVSHRPREGEADRIQVLVATHTGAFEVWWPADVVLPLDLRVERSPILPPTDATAGLQTHKDRFTTRFTVQGVPDPVSMSSVGSASLGALAGALALALRNMVVAGAPWRFTPAPTTATARLRPTRSTQRFTRPDRNTRAQRRRR